MNPTREQFELAAKAAGLTDDRDCTWVEWFEASGPQEEIQLRVGERWKPWQPHIPGVDNAMLAAALKIDQEWTNAYAWASDSGGVHRALDYAPEIRARTSTERRAKAMAWAVFLVAAEIGRTMKENQDA